MRDAGEQLGQEELDLTLLFGNLNITSRNFWKWNASVILGVDARLADSVSAFGKTVRRLP